MGPSGKFSIHGRSVAGIGRRGRPFLVASRPGGLRSNRDCGTVKLRSARPDVKPRIFSNYLATEEDRRSMIRGVQLTMDVAQRPALAAVCRGPHLVPASSRDADVWSFIERHAQTFYHPSSTCGIGRVVDPELRVFGMDGLRVADASVMPSVTRGNTNAPVIAIAERAADLIQQRHL